MDDRVQQEDYTLLGISPGAGPDEVLQAYHRTKALYSEGSLATYSLMPPDERQALIERIEAAYLRLTRHFTRMKDHSQEKTLPGMETGGPAPTDPSQAIGPWLKKRREDRGFTLRELSARSCIRTTHLENLEEERFDQLPAPVYTRGFVIALARGVEVPDPEALATLFLSRMKAAQEKEKP